MRAEDVGLAVSTLLLDPMSATPGDLVVASQAATAAGINGFAMWAQHVEATGRPDEAVIEAWAGRVAVLETAAGFTRGITDRFSDEAAKLVEITARVAAPMLAVCTMRRSLDDAGAAADGLRHLAKLAGERDITVSLEFTPWSGIPDVRTAWRLVCDAGEPNLGLVIDTWHWYRQPGGPAYDLLESIPGDRIKYVQICDAPAEPAADLFSEAMTARLLPGDGAIDFSRLGASLDRIGARPLLMTEIYNRDLASRGAFGMARAIMSSITRLDFIGGT